MTTHIESWLTSVFPKENVSSQLRHFSGMAEALQRAKWEDSMAKAGKFVEASLKALYAHAKLSPLPEPFKVDAYINGLGNSSPASADKTIRVTIPRACRFAYDIASNRGGRHDAGEIDPNEIDANVVSTVCSWILAEMIRYSQRGAGKDKLVKPLVDALLRKKHTLIEHVDGRTYFHGTKASAVDVALVLLFNIYPNRLPEPELIRLLEANRFRTKNAKTALNRIAKYLDRDANDTFLLLATGLEKAEQIIAKASGLSSR